MLNFRKSYSDETELIKDCKKGVRKAQKALYEKYSAKMLSICCRYLKNEAEAEDVMVTALMKVFKHLDSYQGKGSFEGWIRRIVVNEALTALRKKKNTYFEEIENADYYPEYQLTESHLEADDLLKMVANLPTGYRTVFNLYAIEGYSHKEIAEQLNISVSTSKSQLNRARNLLKKTIQMHEDHSMRI